MSLRLALAASTALLLAAPAYAQASLERAAAEVPQSEHDKLFALFDDADARELALNPLNRLFRGEDEGADRLGDFLTDSAFLAARTDTRNPDRSAPGGNQAAKQIPGIIAEIARRGAPGRG